MSLCENPFMVGNFPCPCNKCVPCIKTRRNKWKNRILFESYDHDHSAFITLTYADENLRFQNEETGEFTLPTLVPSDLRNFIKRIRRRSEPTKLRFYACGEYGDRNWRPHYHLGLFGYPPCYRGQTDKRRHSQGYSCCPPCDLLKETWSTGRGKNKKQLGAIDNAPLNDQTASYISGYITKKLTRKDDCRLEGRYPEFQRMSNRPGLGANIVAPLTDALFSSFGKSMLNDFGDVPPFIIQSGKKIHLDRYIRNKLRDEIGVNDATIQASQEAFKKDLFSMYLDEITDEEGAIDYTKAQGLKQFIQSRDKQLIENIKFLTSAYRKDRNL